MRVRIHRKSTIPADKISKKRKKSTIAWRKVVAKYRRCQPKGPPLPPSCNHIKSKFECSLVAQRDMESFHRKFYYTRKKAQQDAFILRHCQGRSPKRKSSVAQKERKLTVEYFVPARERNVQVCKEAFIGILRVNKSRVNALLKSFYKVDISKDSIQEEQSSSRVQIICIDGRRRKWEVKNEIETNSKSLTDIEVSANRDLSFLNRWQSERKACDESTDYSIPFLGNKVELIRSESETSQPYFNEDHSYDWLKLDSKFRSQRTFNWSPLRRTTNVTPSNTVDSGAFDSPQKKNVPVLSFSILFQSSSNKIYSNNTCKEELTDEAKTIENIYSPQNKEVSAFPLYPVLFHSQSNETNKFFYKDAVCESAQQNILSQGFSLHEHVYESKKRRLKKLEITNGKENSKQNSIKKKNNRQIPEQFKKSIINIKKIEKQSFQKGKANRYVAKARFPLGAINSSNFLK